jgi:hypothetical protein
VKERRRRTTKDALNFGKETDILWHRHRPPSSSSKEQTKETSSTSHRSKTPVSIKQRRRKSKEDLLNISSETEILWHRNGPTETKERIAARPSSVSSLAAGVYIPDHLKIQTTPKILSERQKIAVSRNSLERDKARSERNERKIMCGAGETTNEMKPPRAPKRKSRLPPSRSKSSDAVVTSFYWQRQPAKSDEATGSKTMDRSSPNKGNIKLIAQQLKSANEKEQSLLDAVSTLRGRRMPKGRGRACSSASPRRNLEISFADSPTADPAATRRERHRRSLSRDGARDDTKSKEKVDSRHSRSGSIRRGVVKPKVRSDSADRQHSNPTKSSSFELPKSKKSSRKSSSFDSGSNRRSRKRDAAVADEDTLSTAETIITSNR